MIGDNLTPLNPGATETLGIHQSDVIIRTALIAALKDLRANPWKLDYVFSFLPKDELTAKSYGEKDIASAKRWFLATDIPVAMVPRIDKAKAPIITIKLLESSESEVTLGDVHYLEKEEAELDWPALCDPFTPTAYDQATGNVTLPDAVFEQLIVVAGMLIVDAVGQTHEILDILDDNKVQIAANTIADFTGAVIKGSRPAANVTLESAWYKETYQIGIHTSGEPVYLTWLHSIVVFILMHYKEDLLEARGFERSVFNSSDFDREEVSEGEFLYTRFVTMTGNVRQYWPKRVQLRITSFQPLPLRIIDADKLPADTDPNTQLWIGDNDTLTPK